MERLAPSELQTLDGARAVFDDGWILVRPSGTEPKVKIVAEGRTVSAVKRLFKAAKAAVGEAIK
jgi:phosphomannomutase